MQFTSPRQCTTVYIYKLLFPTAPFTFQHFNTFQHFSAQWRKAQIKALPGWAPAFPRLSGTNMPTLITLGLAQICPTILAQICTPFWHRYSHRLWHKFAHQFWHEYAHHFCTKILIKSGTIMPPIGHKMSTDITTNIYQF